MQAPPTRYKVVERGRRLEVIDTWTGQVATPQRRGPEPAERRPATAPQPVRTPIASATKPKLDERGQRILRTAAWYDANGPRDIVVAQRDEAKLVVAQIGVAAAALAALVVALSYWPLLFGLAFILARKAVRQQLRTAATSFLDSLDQAA